jgi:hypothetical protein
MNMQCSGHGPSCARVPGASHVVQGRDNSRGAAYVGGPQCAGGDIGVRAGGERVQLYVRIVVRLHHCAHNFVLTRAVEQITVPVDRYWIGIHSRGALPVRFTGPGESWVAASAFRGARGFPCWFRLQRLDIHAVGYCCCSSARVVSKCAFV